jgi:hypothetical protein
MAAALQEALRRLGLSSRDKDTELVAGHIIRLALSAVSSLSYDLRASAIFALRSMILSRSLEITRIASANTSSNDLFNGTTTHAM